MARFMLGIGRKSNGNLVLPMELVERTRVYLNGLEADRQAALALSRDKAEEAKLIGARLDGFRTALKMFGRQIPESGIGVSDDPPTPATKRATEPVWKRRTRRNIRELIARELSFSGQAMTARQIAKAIEYILERTETALIHMEKDGLVLREEGDRWSIPRSAVTHMNGFAPRAVTVNGLEQKG